MIPGRIRPKAVCVFRRGAEILVAPIRDESRGETYHGPPGGGIEFGERAADAARREMREELDAEIDDVALVGVLENVFTYEGQPGHEILFVFTARFRDPAPYGQRQVHGTEEGNAFTAEWMPLESFAPGGARLVPEGLYELLRGVEDATGAA